MNKYFNKGLSTWAHKIDIRVDRVIVKTNKCMLEFYNTEQSRVIWEGKLTMQPPGD